jgi:hypothetical protein
MKITGVTANNRKRAFEVETRRGAYVMPYAKVDPAPSTRDRIAEVYVDPEIGREGSTYVLQSGEEGVSTSTPCSSTTKTPPTWPTSPSTT